MPRSDASEDERKQSGTGLEAGVKPVLWRRFGSGAAFHNLKHREIEQVGRKVESRLANIVVGGGSPFQQVLCGILSRRGPDGTGSV